MKFPEETDEIRQKATREMALCLLTHLRQELKKSNELLSNTTAEGISFLEHTNNLVNGIMSLFPGIENDVPAVTNGLSANLMEVWWEKSARFEGRASYQDSTFKFMNAISFERIKYAINPSDESLNSLNQSLIENMIKTRIIERGLSISHLLRILGYLTRITEKRFELLGFEPIEAYRTLLERIDNAQYAALFTYYYDLVKEEQARSDGLLRNILPNSLAEKLRNKETPAPVHYDSATVVFTDYVGFSRTAGDMDPYVLVKKLDYYFKVYDDIIDKHGLEKLKTIGDAYMFAGGIPETLEDHAIRCVSAALEIRDYMRNEIAAGKESWSIRIGVHSGPIVAGIIGTKKFSYDIWGDTVNVASRMESTGDSDSVNISADTYEIVKNRINVKCLGTRAIKNRGEMKMYSVLGLKS